MKTKVILVALLVAAAAFWTYAQTGESKSDPRVDKLLEQHEQLLKNQAEILKNQADMMRSLETINTGLQQLRRRSS
jgi:hypothetical protein